MHIFKNFSSKITASKMAASDPSYFADFKHVKFLCCHFIDFEQVKNLIVILLNLNMSKYLVVILLTLNKSKN